MRDMNSYIARSLRQDSMFACLGVLCTVFGVAALCALLVKLALDGAGRIDWQFFFSYPSRQPPGPESCPPGWEPWW